MKSKEQYIQDSFNEQFKFWFRRLCLWSSGLYLIAGILDLIRQPEDLTLLLSYRIITIAVLLTVALAVKKIHDKNIVFHYLIAFAVLFIFGVGAESRVLLTGGGSSPFFVGFIMVGLVFVGFIPGSLFFNVPLAVTLCLIYVIPLMLYDKTTEPTEFVFRATVIVLAYGALLFLRYHGNRRLVTEFALRYELMEHKELLQETVEQRTETLKATEEELQMVLDNTHTGVAKSSLTGELLYVNNAFLELMGYENINEVHDINVAEHYTNPEQRTFIIEKLGKHGRVANMEVDMVTKSGELKTVLMNIVMSGDIVTSIIIDITEQKKARDLVSKSLKEKELLLAEIHHRVGNNMAVISSILGLQAEQAVDNKDRDMFFDTSERLRAMALVHRKLYSSDNFSSIAFGNYISEMVTERAALYPDISIKLDLEDITIGIDYAVPLGMIVSELVGNAFKHAFVSGEKGELNISFRRDSKGETVLIVRDNGIGMPESIDIGNPKTIGLRLLVSLVTQVHGVMEISRDKGTEIKIVFMPVGYINKLIEVEPLI